MNIPNGTWNATSFFQSLTERNILASQHGFRFCKISSPENLEEALASMQNTTAFVCISDSAPGYTSLDNTPHTRRVKTVFLAMRHKLDDMAARNRCFDIMRELFRQFCSVLLQEKTRLEQNCIYLDPRITFNETDEYFVSGCACAFFQIAVDVYTDLRYNPAEWNTDLNS